MKKVIVLTDAELKRKIDPEFVPRSEKFAKVFSEMGCDIKMIHCSEVSLVCEDGKVKIFQNGDEVDGCDVLVNFLSGIGNVLEYDFLARHFEKISGWVVNKADSILTARNKFRTYQVLTENGVKVPRSVYVTMKTWKKRINSFQFPVIIKMTTGNRGVGVMKFDSRNSLIGFLDYYFRGSTQHLGLIIQEFFGESIGQDLRIIVVKGKVLAAMQRCSRDKVNDFRSNISRGAEAIKHQCTKEEAEIAEKAAKALGLNFCGVDLMNTAKGSVVLEVNCMPGLEGIQSVTDFNLIEKVAKEFLSH